MPSLGALNRKLRIKERQAKARKRCICGHDRSDHEQVGTSPRACLHGLSDAVTEVCRCQRFKQESSWQEHEFGGKLSRARHQRPRSISFLLESTSNQRWHVRWPSPDEAPDRGGKDGDAEWSINTFSLASANAVADKP